MSKDIPAFPEIRPVSREGDGVIIGQVIYNGMTLRDYFAGQALMGSAKTGAVTSDGLPIRVCKDKVRLYEAQQIAKWCYELSDAMIAAREGREK